jgi:hypothetical protein
MLAGLEGADRVLGVHRVGEHDVNDVDLRVVLECVVVLVVVDVLRVESVLFDDRRRLLGGVAADEGDELRVLALGEAGDDLVFREAANADDAVAYFSVAIFAADVGRTGDGGGREQGLCEQRTAGALLVLRHR